MLSRIENSDDFITRDEMFLVVKKRVNFLITLNYFVFITKMEVDITNIMSPTEGEVDIIVSGVDAVISLSIAVICLIISLKLVPPMAPI